MTKLGTAYVDVQPDFSAFDRLVTRKLAGAFKGVGEQSGRDFSKAFNTAGVVAPTVEVKANTGQADRALDGIEAKKRAISATDANVKVDVDRSAVGVFSQLAASAQNLFASLGGSGGGGLHGATTRVSAGFISFGSAAGPLAAILAGLAVTIGVSLVGALAALGASLAFAAAGIGGLAAAVAGVLAPAVVLGIAVGSRLGKVFEALKAQDAATDEVGRRAAAGSQAAAAAAAAQESAARGLTDANRQLGEATRNAYREMADAAEAASDAIRGVETAQLSLDRARISTERAKLELEEFRHEAGATGKAFGAVFDKFTDVAVDTSGLKQALRDANQAAGGPKLDKSQELELRDRILAVREARNREKEATDGVSDAMRTATRAQQVDNQFKRQGIAASQGYQSALRGVETATLAVAAAQKQEGFSAAQTKAIDLTNDLSAAEQRLLEKLKQVREELRGAFKPATDAVFGGMLTALGRMPALINPLRPAFTRLGEAVGDAFDSFSGDLIQPDSISKLKTFTNGAARLAGPITDGISALLDILTDIGRAALPYLISGTEKVADKLKEWAVATGDTDRLNASMKSLMGHLKTWLGVGASIANVFLAFLPTAAGEGKSLAESIKGVADRTAAWLRSDEGKDKMKKFFKDAVAFAKDLGKFIAELVVFTASFGRKAAAVFTRVVDKLGGAEAAATAFVAVLGTLVALKFARGLINGAKDAKRAFDATKKASTLMHASFTTGNAITRTATKVQAGLTAVLNGSALAAARQKAVLIGLRIQAYAAAIATGAMTAATKLFNLALRANPIGLIVTALIALGGGLVIAYKKSETFRRIVDGAFAAVKTGAVKAIQGIIWILDKLMGAWSSVLTALAKVPGFGWAKRAAGLIDRAREKLRGLADGLNGLPKITSLKVIVDAELSDDMRKLLDDVGDGTKNPLRKSHRNLRHYGGMIPGVGDSDSVRALLTPGEHVTQKRIVQLFGATVFADINEGRLDPRIGYGKGDRPSVSTAPVRGNRFATGGLVGAGGSSSITHVSAPITVVGGGPPDVVDLSSKLGRLIESRAGGSPRD